MGRYCIRWLRLIHVGNVLPGYFKSEIYINILWQILSTKYHCCFLNTFENLLFMCYNNCFLFYFQKFQNSVVIFFLVNIIRHNFILLESKWFSFKIKSLSYVVTYFFMYSTNTKCGRKINKTSVHIKAKTCFNFITVTYIQLIHSG